MIYNYRIHGDNIVECKRTLSLISEALGKQATLIKSLVYKPTYSIKNSSTVTYHFTLLSGHNRWGINLTECLLKSGGVLRECADSYVTKIENGIETILFAIEYCSALPAGNNAWQRNGRAYSCIMSGIPYLYFAELGGVELDENRIIKSQRFPNPLVPFSYISASKANGSLCLPVYKPHPSITETLFDNLRESFGLDDSLNIIKSILKEEPYVDYVNNLINKCIYLVKILSSGRRYIDTLRNDEWINFLNYKNKAKWLLNNSSHLIWNKKISNKIPTTKSFNKFFNYCLGLGCLSIGSRDLPICLIPEDKKKQLLKFLTQNYKNIKFDLGDKPLAIVWITGFKPHGDDSRPDRGLCPLSKMILGNSANILAVIYGPALKETWDTFENDIEQLEEENGLWQSILKIADYVLVDSSTSKNKLFYKNETVISANKKQVKFKCKIDSLDYSEQDTDTSIHQLLVDLEDKGIYECMCNPPGGDWSGVSIYIKDKEYRWTSLPRVSKIGGKRPDHLFQINIGNKLYYLSIESKKNARDLEEIIGPKLEWYVNDLFSSNPSASRSTRKDWRMYDSISFTMPKYEVITIGAFEYNGIDEMEYQLSRGKLDAIFAFEFGDETVLHILDQSGIVEQIVKEASLYISMFKVQVH